MNLPSDRAWRFVHPDFDVSEGPAGLRTSATGGIDMVEEAASVRQAVLLLLSTRRGERVMRPDYGCDLHRLVFSPNDDTTAGLAIEHVRHALNRWEPRIDILRIDAGPNPDNRARLDIVVEYRVRATLRTDALTLGMSLTGEQL
jgi:phage baseplate assembly protein W